MKLLITCGHQGDVSFRKINKLPGIGLVRMKYDKMRGGYVLALGERSGHAHVIVAEKEDTQTIEVLLDPKTGKHYLSVRSPVSLLHGTFVAPQKINETEVDKHDEIKIGIGIWEQEIEDDYDPFLQLVRKVVD